jgi:Asp-tRNA(Asn)/Glu-tRNA(Gln) amidotransferase A subunit family amidase
VPAPARREVAGLRLAVPETVVLDGLDATVAAAFERALARLSAAGARITRLAVPEFAELAALNARGTLSAAEAWAWHRALLNAHEADYDPRVALRIRGGENMNVADYIDLLAAPALDRAGAAHRRP